MNTSRGGAQTPQIAVWYFVGATFAFAAPALFFPDASLWVRIVLFAVGVGAMIGGGIQLGREMKHTRDRPGEAPSDPGA